MNTNKMVEECLTSLFEGYLENGGTPVFSLGEIIKSFGYTPEEGGKHLVDHGWVKDYQYRGTDFVAAISIDGIKKGRPDWVNSNIHKAMSVMCLAGGEQHDLMEALDFQQKDHQIGRDIDKFLQEMDLIEKPRYTAHNIIVHLTLTGRDFCETNMPRFGN